MALMIDRRISLPGRFAKRSCLQVSCRLPGLPFCHLLCHDPGSGLPGAPSGLIGFFVLWVERLVAKATGNQQA